MECPLWIQAETEYTDRAKFSRSRPIFRLQVKGTTPQTMPHQFIIIIITFSITIIITIVMWHTHEDFLPGIAKVSLISMCLQIIHLTLKPLLPLASEYKRH